MPIPPPPIMPIIGSIPTPMLRTLIPIIMFIEALGPVVKPCIEALKLLPQPRTVLRPALNIPRMAVP